MTTKETLGIAVGAISVALTLLAVLGLSNATYVQTQEQGSDGVTVTTSPEQIEAQGQTTKVTPDGKSTTSFEASISEEGIDVGVTHEQEFNLSNEVEETVNGAQDAISDAQELTNDLQDQLKTLSGQ